jgi:hypothetical protein
MTLPAAGGHSGSGISTSSPGSSTLWQTANMPWMPPLVTITSSGAPIGMPLRFRSFSTSRSMSGGIPVVWT